MNRFSRRILMGSALAVPFASRSHAQGEWPSRTVRILVGFAPGGGADLVGRLLARGLADQLGRPVVVENRPGAGGRVAAQATAQAEPDGYTLVIGSTSLPIAMALDPAGALDAPAVLRPAALFAEAPNVLVANPQLPVRSVQELVAFARTRPGGVSFASSGVGTSLHLSGELLRMRSGAPMTHVPYRGSGPALTALIAGEVQFMFDSLATAKPHIDANAVRALAVTTSQRTPLIPSVPTMQESGYSGFDISVWYGVFGPRNLPDAIADRLSREINTLLDSSALAAQLAAISSTVLRSESPAAAERHLRAEVARWREIVRSTGVQVQG
ncbi:MAG: tripartite tricarboxylate transporter substrate binding protein [Roseomonas sp.]|nr:tripartite tricarboxylate transporter substrate binding protein [Roseomonas sp.]